MGADASNSEPFQRRVPFTRGRTILSFPSIVMVGASTGGPQALTALITGLAAARTRVPICVTLHMPAELMPIIATHVARTCGVETRVVVEPQPLVAGTVYFSPGDRHLTFRKGGAATTLQLAPSAPGEYCKPGVDVMFASGAACFGIRTLGVVLSGMGKDGLSGARAIVSAGGSVLVQDKTSSAVWGMPGAIVKAELAEAVLPPNGLAAEIVRRLVVARSA